MDGPLTDSGNPVLQPIKVVSENNAESGTQSVVNCADSNGALKARAPPDCITIAVSRAVIGAIM